MLLVGKIALCEMVNLILIYLTILISCADSNEKADSVESKSIQINGKPAFKLSRNDVRQLTKNRFISYIDTTFQIEKVYSKGSTFYRDFSPESDVNSHQFFKIGILVVSSFEIKIGDLKIDKNTSFFELKKYFPKSVSNPIAKSEFKILLKSDKILHDAWLRIIIENSKIVYVIHQEENL